MSIQEETRTMSFEDFVAIGAITGLSCSELRPLWDAMQPVLSASRADLPAALANLDLEKAAKEMAGIRNVNRVLDAAALRPRAEEPVL